MGITQCELSQISGINLWLIQNYEQKKNDVNSVKVLIVINLSRALRCKAKDFIKY